jgi:hypothetical protein
MNVNIQFVIQNHQMIYYHVQVKENVYLQIVVFVIQDFILLIVHYIIAKVKNLMIQQFVLEMVNAFHQKIVTVLQVGLMKIAKLILVIQHQLIQHQFAMVLVIVLLLIIVLVIMVIGRFLSI